MVTCEERDIRTRFRDRYREDRTEAVVRIERAVIGGDWGANGYTTMQQVDHLADALRLTPGVRLLDLGAGRGWPGLYLAVSTGCHVVLSDVPLEGLRTALARAGVEHVDDRVVAVASSARALPLRAGTFDAVVHTDVLCCLRAKLSVLRATRRMLRPGGRTAFFTIHPAPGLNPRQRRRAHREGPVAVASHLSQGDLLERAGFVDIEETDCTDAFAAVARAWIEQGDAHRDDLVATLGETEFEQRQRDRRTQSGAIDDGLLRRSMLVAVRPGTEFHDGRLWRAPR